METEKLEVYSGGLTSNHEKLVRGVERMICHMETREQANARKQRERELLIANHAIRRWRTV